MVSNKELVYQFIVLSRRIINQEDRIDRFDDLQSLSELEEAEESAATDTQKISAELRVAMPLSFGLAYLTSAIIDFMHENSAVNIDADLNDRAIDSSDQRG